MSQQARPVADLVAQVGANQISREEALLELDPRQVAPASLSVDPGESEIAHGVPAGPGVASGHAVFDAVECLRFAAAGLRPILIVHETVPEDIEAMRASAGVVTVDGGLTGHAAIVSRGLGKPCLASRGALELLAGVATLRTSPPVTWKPGHALSFDGKTGSIFEGMTRLTPLSDDLLELLGWADQTSGERVIASVASAIDATNARLLGASAISIDSSDALWLSCRESAGEVGSSTSNADLLTREIAAIVKAFGAEPVSVRLGVLDERATDQALGSAIASACSTAAVIADEQATPERRAAILSTHPGARFEVSPPVRPIWPVAIAARRLEAARAVLQQKPQQNR